MVTAHTIVHTLFISFTVTYFRPLIVLVRHVGTRYPRHSVSGFDSLTTKWAPDRIL